MGKSLVCRLQLVWSECVSYKDHGDRPGLSPSEPSARFPAQGRLMRAISSWTDCLSMSGELLPLSTSSS